ncbi:MAG: 50S ribosomal protein L23 [uncultured bacterium]|nr:MAG: 50S ribosomal protein L23 [uncultured bacterium]
MGLLDRWSKKKETERLEKPTAKKEAVVTEEKTVASKPATKAASKAKKPAAKKVAAKKEVEGEVVDEHNHEHTEKAPAKLKKIINTVLVKAMVTEKSAVKQSENKYTFVVVNNANKALIGKAIFAEYGVKPVRVNVMNMPGKKVRYGRSQGKRSDYKKAVVTLPKGKTIVVHEGV